MNFKELIGKLGGIQEAPIATAIGNDPKAAIQQAVANAVEKNSNLNPNAQQAQGTGIPGQQPALGPKPTQAIAPQGTVAPAAAAPAAPLADPKADVNAMARALQAVATQQKTATQLQPNTNAGVAQQQAVQQRTTQQVAKPGEPLEEAPTATAQTPEQRAKQIENARKFINANPSRVKTDARFSSSSMNPKDLAEILKGVDPTAQQYLRVQRQLDDPKVDATAKEKLETELNTAWNAHYEARAKAKETPKSKDTDNVKKTDTPASTNVKKSAYKGSARSQEIQKLNPDIKDVNKIFTGQELKMPDGSTYTVKKGDTLDAIASSTPATATANTNTADTNTASTAQVDNATAQADFEKRLAVQKDKEAAAAAKAENDKTIADAKAAYDAYNKGDTSNLRNGQHMIGPDGKLYWYDNKTAGMGGRGDLKQITQTGPGDTFIDPKMKAALQANGTIPSDAELDNISKTPDNRNWVGKYTPFGEKDPTKFQLGQQTTAPAPAAVATKTSTAPATATTTSTTSAPTTLSPEENNARIAAYMARGEAVPDWVKQGYLSDPLASTNKNAPKVIAGNTPAAKAASGEAPTVTTTPPESGGVKATNGAEAIPVVDAKPASVKEDTIISEMTAQLKSVAEELTEWSMSDRIHPDVDYTYNSAAIDAGLTGLGALATATGLGATVGAPLAAVRGGKLINNLYKGYKGAQAIATNPAAREVVKKAAPTIAKDAAKTTAKWSLGLTAADKALDAADKAIPDTKTSDEVPTKESNTNELNRISQLSKYKVDTK